MAIMPVIIKVKPGRKTGNESRPIVDAVRRGNYINEGDRGAYIVGVFACRDVASDGKTYSLEQKQWKYCLFKEQWEAVLKGQDIFTDEEKALVLAGYELLKSFSHGWGQRAIEQSHVMQLINKWSGQIEGIGRQGNTPKNPIVPEVKNYYQITEDKVRLVARALTRERGKDNVTIEAICQWMMQDTKDAGEQLAPDFRDQVETILSKITASRG